MSNNKKRSHEERKEALVNLIENELYTDDVVSAWNEYCDKRQYMDDKIFYLEEIDEFFSSASDFLDHLNNFSSAHRYFHFNGYGNVNTLDDCDVIDEIDSGAMADYCLDYGDDLGDSDIQDLLEEFEEEDEEEEDEEDEEDEEE